MGVRVTDGSKLIIYEVDSGQILAEHALCLHKKGELIRNNNHGRDRTKGIQAYIDHVAKLFTDVDQAQQYLEEIRKRKPRYIRDQLQAIEKGITEVNVQTADKALAYCVKHALYRAVDFADAIKHFQDKQPQTPEKPVQSDLKLLDQADTAKLKAKPQIRDFNTYKRILEGGYR